MGETILAATIEAAQQIDTYRHPDITAWVKRIDEVLKAAEISTIGNDKVEDITVGQDTIWIKTSWSSRGCEQVGTVQVPRSILEAPNPYKAAKIWASDRKLLEAQNAVKTAQANLGVANTVLARLQIERRDLEAGLAAQPDEVQ